MSKEIVTAETNLNGKKERATPIPKDAMRILAGALKLPLANRVGIKNAIQSSIDNELQKLETEYAEAKKLITGQ